MDLITHGVVCGEVSEGFPAFCLESFYTTAVCTLKSFGIAEVYNAAYSAQETTLSHFLEKSGYILYLNSKCPDLSDGDISLFSEVFNENSGCSACLVSPGGAVLALVSHHRACDDDIPDIAKIAEVVCAVHITCGTEVICGKWQAAKRAKSYTERLLEKLCDEKGLIIINPDGIVISPLAEIGEGVTLYPNVQIYSGSVIGDGTTITSSSVISNSKIGLRCTVNACQIYDSVLEDEVKIGPFCHVRPNSYICKGAKIGDFVEIKNSTIGEATHISHLTYVGDSDVGKRVNFGCGTVTVNYDGKRKFRTTIEDDAFIGCNTNLVAPVTVGEGAFTGAGSTITKDVPPYSLAISRTREQTIIDDWVKNRK